MHPRNTVAMLQASVLLNHTHEGLMPTGHQGQVEGTTNYNADRIRFALGCQRQFRA